MSFITKRERVFNEYDLFDLPARNEGKLKAYASCTDARAWSHFCSDKSEHLAEVIKRNNETVRPKYIPTDVIVNTLMTSKNAEIARLKRKIEEFEQMLAAYDQLELTYDQKCDIANAHAAIKAANKELDEMCLDLDFSGFTEGIDSEAFETGKSRGDEPSRYTSETRKSRGDEWAMGISSTPKMETKSNQIGAIDTCDASTSAHDKRIDELQETIITKDAKLSAMQNTIAVLENDVCEPYCVYANIYTALEKIFGTLCQNGKYKQYLDLLTTGKDTRGIDIKGKILFKMKVLEKFSLALIAPCSQEFNSVQHDCSCYHAEIVTHVETTFALTSAEIKLPSLDDKRAHLVADIMQNEDIKEILTKDNSSQKTHDNRINVDYDTIENYNIDVENLYRLKTLQANYEDLLNYYDNLKHEKNELMICCQKYADLKNECDHLQDKLREYNQLWKEKEYFRKRSEDLDALRNNYLVLSEETSNIETKLKAEQEFNKNKSANIDELRNENVKLEKKITEISLSFEKQRNTLVCKLKESECKMMLQEQQIKSLQSQIDRFLEQEINKIAVNDFDPRLMQLIDEIKSYKEQIKNLKDALCCNEEEKYYFQGELEKKLELINDLKLKIEDWKNKYEKTLEINNYLEKCFKECNIEVNDLRENNTILNESIEMKTSAIENLNGILYSKSQEISSLIDEVDRVKYENQDLCAQVQSIHNSLEYSKASYDNEKKLTLSFIYSAKKESLELLESVKKCGEVNTNDSNVSITSIIHNQERKGPTKERTIDDVNFPQEIQLMHHINLDTLRILQIENNKLKNSFDFAIKENENLQSRLANQSNILENFEKLRKSHENLLNEKNKLQCDLNNKTHELDNVLQALQLTKKESENVIDQAHKTESIRKEYIKLNELYHIAISDRNMLQKKLLEYERELKDVANVEQNLSNIYLKYNKIKETNTSLQDEYDNQSKLIKDFHLNLEKKDEEIRELNELIQKFKTEEQIINSDLETVKSDNFKFQTRLKELNSEKIDLLNKLKHYEQQDSDFNVLIAEKETIKQDLQKKKAQTEKLHEENYNLNTQIETLLRHIADLEQALINARDENLTNSDTIRIHYDDLKKEINNLHEEKLHSIKKIRHLMDEIDESDFIRSNLSESIISKDKRISTLENHINALEEEIRILQFDLNQVLQTGEELKKLSSERLHQSFKIIEAHHSKANHNMKVDLKQRNTNANLVEQLSMVDLMAKESLKSRDEMMTKIQDLQKERETILSNIRRLELQSLGDSSLTLKNCSVNEMKKSLVRIGKFIEDKNKSLKETLSNIQASYQLLQSKAEEAKTVAEMERQKIINEKEVVQKERKKIQEDLENLRNDKGIYEKMVNDLEGEMSNQKLIFDRIIQMHEDDIRKLKDENLSLQNLYETALKNNNELQDQLDILNRNNLSLSDKINNNYKEISSLKSYIEKRERKNNQDFTAQVFLPISNKNKECQSSIIGYNIKMEHKNDIAVQVSTTAFELLPKTIEIINSNEHIKFLKLPNVSTKEPSFESLKNLYINYKTRQLSLGKLEQYSITNSYDNNTSEQSHNDDVRRDFLMTLPKTNNLSLLNNNNTIDIYSTQMFTKSNKNVNDFNSLTNNNKTMSKKSSNVQNSENSRGTLEELIKIPVVYKDSTASSDKDIFLIYKSSQSVDELLKTENKSWQQNYLKTVIVEKAIIETKENLFPAKKEKIREIRPQSRDKTNRDNDSRKQKLEINIPRILTDPASTTTYDGGQTSLNSDVSSRWVVQSDSKINSNDSIINTNSVYEATGQNSTQKHSIIFSNHKIKKHIVQIKPFNRSEWNADNGSDNKNGNNTNFDPKLSHTVAKTAVLNHVEKSNIKKPESNYTMDFIIQSVKNDFNFEDSKELKITKSMRKCHSEENLGISGSGQVIKSNLFQILPAGYESISEVKSKKSLRDRAILVKLDTEEHYEKKIQQLTDAYDNMEKEYKRKIKTIKSHYDNNIKHIINEHNQGVESIQNLHEDTVHEIVKKHENEIENLRTMSIEAMRKADRLENENYQLKSKLIAHDNSTLDEVPVEINTPELKRRKGTVRPEGKTLTKTIVDTFNVKPTKQSHGPCTCFLGRNVSDAVRNIIKQVDVEQRKMEEIVYLKNIANKILNNNVETLDAQELSFLHLKVCRTWKARLNKEENLQKKIDCLESELIKKQRQTQKHMADLDRKVVKEWVRLQEVREAICRDSPIPSRDVSPKTVAIVAEKDVCNCNSIANNPAKGRLSNVNSETRPCRAKSKRVKMDSNRDVIAKSENDGRREKKAHGYEAPTRLKRSQDRQNLRTNKK